MTITLHHIYTYNQGNMVSNKKLKVSYCTCDVKLYG